MNTMKKQSNTRPPDRAMTGCEAPSSSGPLAITSSTTEARTTSGMSDVSIFLRTAIGLTSAVAPTIISVLKIFDPTTLPTASGAAPLTAEIIEMANSGADVPNATTVSPTMRSDMPIRRATSEAPSVRKFAPKIISKRPIMR